MGQIIQSKKKYLVFIVFSQGITCREQFLNCAHNCFGYQMVIVKHLDQKYEKLFLALSVSRFPNLCPC